MNIIIVLVMVAILAVVVFAIAKVLFVKPIKTVPFMYMKDGQSVVAQNGMNVSCQFVSDGDSRVIVNGNKVQLLHKNGSYQESQWYDEKGDKVYIC